MKAVAVASFGAPPEFMEVPKQSIVDIIGVLLDVLAAGLHAVVRAQDDGSRHQRPRTAVRAGN